MLVERNYVYSPSLGLLAPYTNEEQLSKIVNHFNEREDLYHKLPISYSCQEQNFFEKYSTSAGINLTSACQLRCNYCTYKSGEQDITLNEQDVYAFINFLVKNLLIKRKVLGENGRLKIYFSGGGEPTYHWDLLKNIVLYIQKTSNKFDIKYELYITTNGMLNNQQIKFLMENFTGILISFDGLPDIQGRNRKMPHGFSSFDVVKNVLDILNKNNFNFSIRTTIWPHNYFLLNDMAKYIFNTFSNVKKWEIFPVSQQGRAENTPTFTKNNTQSISNYSLCESYLSLLSKLDKKDFNRISIPLFKNYETLYECGTAFGNYPWLNSDGKIITCIEAKEKATVLGGVSNGIVTCNRYIDNLSIEHIKSCNKTCFDCIAYRYCGCGCPLKNSNLELGSDIQQDWICANMKEYWKVVFDNLIERREFNGWKLYLQGEESNINYYSIERVL